MFDQQLVQEAQLVQQDAADWKNYQHFVVAHEKCKSFGIYKEDGSGKTDDLTQAQRIELMNCHCLTTWPACSWKNRVVLSKKSLFDKIITVEKMYYACKFFFHTCTFIRNPTCNLRHFSDFHELYVCLTVQLKDQKKPKGKKKKRRSGAGPQKMAKQTPLPLSFWKTMFTGLQPRLQEEVVDGLIKRNLSIAEAKVEISGKYVLQRATEHLTEQLKCNSWEEVQEEFKDRVSLPVLQQICSKYTAKKMIGGLNRKEMKEYGRIETVSVNML